MLSSLCARFRLAWWLPALAIAASAFARPGTPAVQVVGQTAAGLETPVNQLVTPAGRLVPLAGMRPNAIAVSPDGRRVVTSGLKSTLAVIDAASGAIVQQVPFPAARRTYAIGAAAADELNPNSKAKLSFTGLVFSPDGTRIYLSNVNGDIKVFAVDAQGQVSGAGSFELPPANAPGRVAEIPAGLAVSRDGARLYVALNLSNRLAELDARTGALRHTWDVGVAPFGVALAGHKAYVTNWAGRRPDRESVVEGGGRGTVMRIDDNSVAAEGSVSIIDLEANTTRELVTGRSTSAIVASPDEHQIVVANTGSDTLTVIDTATDQVVETVCARWNPADLFGAQPNALAFDPDGTHLFVTNGTQNAVGVFEFRGRPRPLAGPVYQPGRTKLLGLVPVGWYPGGIAYNATRHELCVANMKGIATEKEQARLGHGLGYNTHQYMGSVSLVPVPSAAELGPYTRTALDNLRYPLLQQAALPPRSGQPARAVPERVGEPSVFRHVIYIIKENRSFDQVFGDAGGNGDPALCTFGEKVTPNQHKLTREFVLLDNTYCCSTLSADGHKWTDSALANDYVERSFAGWPRSYGADALAYASTGFIWTDALAHGRSVVNFGEFASATPRWKDATRRGRPHFPACYRDFVTGENAVEYVNDVRAKAVRGLLAPEAIGWSLEIPDVTRAARFIAALHRYEASDSLPALTIMWLPNDHTSGTRPGTPTPAAHVADNDLAVGRVVEALSHSRYWQDTCLFAIEDDPQNGWDHVSAYRTTAYAVSAYTKRHAVVSTQYNQLSLLRTMELMLGLPPMTQMDATATPMTDCFNNQPDLTPYVAVPNQIPLDQYNPAPAAIADPRLRRDAEISAQLPLDDEDDCPEDVFNGILWRAMKGPNAPYPTAALTARND